MEWVETTGPTVAEALDAALDQLGVDEHDVEYEVLTEPRGGLLGRFGGGDARVRARVKPISREKPAERHRRTRRGRPTEATEKTGPTDAADASTPSATATDVNDADDTGARSGRRRRRRGGQAQPEQPAEQGENVEDGEETFEVPVEDQARTAEEFTRGLVESFGTGATVSSRIEDGAVEIEIEGRQLGLFVGPRGSTLAAIEELVRTVVQRHTGGHGARIHVDVGGYRAKRREALSEFTRELARKVLEDGREQALEPMAAPDRKVVHDTVAEIEGVTTVSEGEEPRRRVVIRRA